MDMDASIDPDVLLYGNPETHWRNPNAIDNLPLAYDLSEKSYSMLILRGINERNILLKQKWFAH